MPIAPRSMSYLFSSLFLVSCAAGSPAHGPAELQLGEQTAALWWQPKVLRVMTRNMYVGTDLAKVLAAPAPEDVPVRAAQAYATIGASDVPARMEAIAREIAATQPDLVGLQEVSLIRTQSPGDAVVGGATPATEVALDFLDLLEAALAAEGLDYKVVAKVQNFDVEAPMITSASTFDDVRLTDFDVILARRDVVVANVVTQNYAASFTAQGFAVKRGFEMVDATVRGKKVRFVNTHLESFVPEIRLAQANELAQRLTGEQGPVIAVGDYNSPAPDDSTYQLLVGAGLRDGWATGLHLGQGFTCCQDGDLRNQSSILDQRIDMVFLRNSPKASVLALTVGDQPWQKTGLGLWPSDHAGLAAAIIY